MSRTASSAMRPWIPLLALSLAAPALAQQGRIEVQPLEPLIAPGATQNNDGGIVVRPVEPLEPPEEGAAAPAPESERDPFSEGFNDDAFGGDEEQPSEGSLFDNRGTVREGEGSFIDRAFRTQQEPGQETETESFEDFALQPLDEPTPDAPEEGETGLFGSDSRGEAPSDGTAALGEAEDKPRFVPAPFTTRGLYGPNRPSALPRVATVPAEGVELRQLDKMTGASRTVTMKAGQERELGRLRVRLEACHAPQDGGTHGTMAFLRMWDPAREAREPVFSGWMFADSPALSAMDHPRYDVWVLGCTPMHAADAESAEKPGEG